MYNFCKKSQHSTAFRARTKPILASGAKMTKRSAKPGGEGGNPEYFQRLTVVRLVRGISGNTGRAKRKGNEAPHTLEGKGERNCVNRKE